MFIHYDLQTLLRIDFYIDNYVYDFFYNTPEIIFICSFYFYTQLKTHFIICTGKSNKTRKCRHQKTHRKNNEMIKYMNNKDEFSTFTLIHSKNQNVAVTNVQTIKICM